MPQHARVEVASDGVTLNNAQRNVANDKSGRALSEVRLQTPSTSSSRGLQKLSKAQSFFPFEESMSKEDFPIDEETRATQYVEYGSTDDDFNEPLERSVLRSRITEFPARKQSESELRANQKRKKVQREAEVQKRQAAGEKPYYIMVSGSGTPYGDGVTAWKAELNKLCRALDPSICDVRQQPHKQMQILKKRLTDNFDYSDRISDRYLIPLIGHQVSARRNFLISKIKEGKPPPSGCNLEAWNRLTDICKSPNFMKKSAAMTYANSCRQNYGRTGPSGEIGVRDALKTELRRSPDPEEVQAEMIRDKGYGGKKKKTKELREKNGNMIHVIEEEKHENVPQCVHDLHVNDVQTAAQTDILRSGRCGGNDTPMHGIEILQKILVEMESLKARVDGLSARPPLSTADVVPSRLAETSPESSCQRIQKEVLFPKELLVYYLVLQMCAMYIQLLRTRQACFIDNLNLKGKT